jgi:hypothetical protein
MGPVERFLRIVGRFHPGILTTWRASKRSQGKRLALHFALWWAGFLLSARPRADRSAFRFFAAASDAFLSSDYKTLMLILPAVMWEQLLDGLDIEQRATVLGQVKSPEVFVEKRSIKAAIDGGADVPGASLVTAGTF